MASKGRALGTVLDVRDATSLSAWVDATVAEFGAIDMVVNSVSALAIPDTEENWYESFNVDMMGTVNLSKLVIPTFGEERCGVADLHLECLGA